jgi:DNA-binding NarL/FixJ family response regulator
MARVARSRPRTPARSDGSTPVDLVAEDEVLARRIATVLTDAGIPVGARSVDLQVPTAPRKRSGAILVLGLDGAGRKQGRLVREATGAPGKPRVVVVSHDATPHGVRSAIGEGAAGYVCEPDLEAALPATIRAVQTGQLAVPRDLRAPVEKPPLSHREKQILGMVVLGLANAEIADKLYLSESTVKSHLSSAFGKLGVSSRKEAAALVLDAEEGTGMGVLAISDDQAG